MTVHGIRRRSAAPVAVRVEGRARVATSAPEVGRRIREERLRLGMSLRKLARDVGVSASMISQIETGKSQPSVSTLYAITSALGVPVDAVFRAAEPDPPVAAPAAGGAVAAGPSGSVRSVGSVGSVGVTVEPLPGGGTMAGLLGTFQGRRLGPLVHEADREALVLDSGVRWERLGAVPQQHVDFLLITYPPGGTSSSTGTLMRHSGCEYGFLLSGALVLTLGFEEIQLGPGDAVSFDSATPHSYRNDGTEVARGVWCVVEQPH